MFVLEGILEMIVTVWGWIKAVFSFFLEILVNCGDVVVDIVVAIFSSLGDIDFD